jgi:hypothetical protein
MENQYTRDSSNCIKKHIGDVQNPRHILKGQIDVWNKCLEKAIKEREEKIICRLWNISKSKNKSKVKLSP